MLRQNVSKHSVALQHLNVIVDSRASVIRSARTVRNERTVPCTDVCMQL